MYGLNSQLANRIKIINKNHHHLFINHKSYHLIFKSNLIFITSSELAKLSMWFLNFYLN